MNEDGGLVAGVGEAFVAREEDFPKLAAIEKGPDGSFRENGEGDEVADFCHAGGYRAFVAT